MNVSKVRDMLKVRRRRVAKKRTEEDPKQDKNRYSNKIEIHEGVC